MAAFSYQQHFHPFLIDSSSNTMTLPTQTNIIYNSNKMFGFNFEQPTSNNTLQPYFSLHDQFYNPRDVDVVVDPLVRAVSNSVLNNSCTTITATTTTTSSCSNNNSSSGQQINDKITSTTTTTSTINPMDHNKRKLNYDATSSAAQSMESGEVVAAVVKGKKQRKMINTTSNNSVEGMKKSSVHDKKEEDDDNKSNKNKKKLKNMKAAAQSSEDEEATPNGYVHVRARRGQATDSHSLAERVRREKISERMKLLQALVPGCDKVTGKALMLDEIINYVQSLKNQVEFLSMKLASFNPMFYDFGVDMEAFMVKPEQADVRECSRNQSTTNALTATPNNNFTLPDLSALLLLQQGQMPNILPQSHGQLLWDTDEVQIQRISSQSSGFSINNLPSFL